MPIAGVMVGWFVDKDVPSCGLCQVAVSCILLVIILFILAVGPWKLLRWHRNPCGNNSAASRLNGGPTATRLAIGGASGKG